MFSLLSISVVLASTASPPQSTDTLAVPTRTTAPVIDGRADIREYGAASLHIPTTTGDVQVWVTRSGGFLYIAASLPDSSYYWGDDFVLSLDADGSADTAPQTGDRQFYLRRLLDSSVVSTASNGRWETPGTPTRMLGATRHHEEWDVASTSTATGWTVELRVRENVFHEARPRVAFRTYNDGPRGWWSWPAPPSGTPAQRVERSPQLWIPLVFR